MKKSIVKKLSIISCILVTYFLFFIASCHQTKQISGSGKGKTPFDKDALPDQLIVWRKPGKSNGDYEKWLAGFRKEHGEVKDQYACGDCDNSLILLSGSGVKTFIQTEAVKGQVTPSNQSPTTGDVGPVYISRNYRVRHNKPKIHAISSIEGLVPGINSGKPVRVAVFDTGADPQELSNYSFNYGGGCCIKGAESGWNFVEHNNNFRDDDDIKHGTIVTRFITDQVKKFGKNGVEILPVKTHDKDGQGDLYGVLCGFAYAQKMGVQIINASFGFYVPRRKFSPEDDPDDPDVLLLRKYVEYYLTRNKILLVTAAGNSDNVNLKKTFEEHGWPYRPDDPRNLNQVSFYPASLARSPEFPNVIAVTTVYIRKNGEGAVSPSQNFSKNVVDIGVNADATIGEDYVFNNPILNNRETIEGSSFAAPIVTGMLCANYDRIKAAINSNKFKKEDIWDALESKLIWTNRSLREQIKDGRVTQRLK